MYGTKYSFYYKFKQTFLIYIVVKVRVHIHILSTNKLQPLPTYRTLIVVKKKKHLLWIIITKNKTWFLFPFSKAAVCCCILWVVKINNVIIRLYYKDSYVWNYLNAFWLESSQFVSFFLVFLDFFFVSWFGFFCVLYNGCYIFFLSSTSIQ